MQRIWKATGVLTGAAMLFAAGLLVGQSGMAKKPKSVIHVITFRTKPETTPEQLTAAMAATEKLARDYPGIKNVWTKAVKVQVSEITDGKATGKLDPAYKNAIVMEFTDMDAFKKYTEAPAHRDWEKTYLAIRGESRTHDITND